MVQKLHPVNIFPRSELRRKGFDESEINRFANLWILAKGKNQNKTNVPPAEYFEDVHASVLKKALINRKLLDYRQFRKFVNERTAEMVNYLRNELHFTDSDFKVAADA